MYLPLVLRCRKRGDAGGEYGRDCDDVDPRLRNPEVMLPGIDEADISTKVAAVGEVARGVVECDR